MGKGQVGEVGEGALFYLDILSHLNSTVSCI